MSDSLRLLLEDFLGLMREDGELDVFLPMLMAAMGHEVVYRPQKGSRQYGVDIASVGVDESGETRLHLWLVKCGDIGRTDWNSGPQSIRQSIDDIRDVYLRSHVAPEHKSLKRKLLVVTNGDFLANLNETIAGYLEQWCRRTRTTAEQVNGSKLAAWTERHLLDEYVLPPSNRTLLRRMLANVSNPELCVLVGRELIDEVLGVALEQAKSVAATAKRRIAALRGVRTALRVLLAWATAEDNLRAAYDLHQYAVLAAWARLHGQFQLGDEKLAQEYSSLVLELSAVAEAYHQRMDAYYVVQDAFANALPDHLLVSATVFDELGRLGQQGCFWAFYGVVSGGTAFDLAVHRYVHRVKMLLRSHSCSALPAYDYHATNVHVALLLLMAAGEREVAEEWLRSLCQRLSAAASARRYLPMTALFEDALAVRHGREEAAEELYNTSRLFPILCTWAAALGMVSTYTFLRDEVMRDLRGVTPNFWSSEHGFDAVVADGQALHEHGIGEAVTQVHEDPKAFLREMASGLEGVEHIEQSAWYQLRAAHIPLLAAVYWHVQLPREMVVQQATALAEQATKTGMTETSPGA